MEISKQPILSVVIPCYNEASGIDELLRRLFAVCIDNFADNYEIVLVNDGSEDETWNIIKAYAHKCTNIVGVNLAKNHGHQLALSAGLEICSGDLIFILDADLQDPPELLSDMRRKIDEGYDVVYGQRRKRAGETYLKKTTASIFYRLLNKFIDVEIPNDTGDFRLITRRVLNHLNAMPERFRFIRGMISWVGFSQIGLLYDRDPRFSGDTKYSFKKMLLLALDAITSFSILPLRLAVTIGVLFAIAGWIMLGWVIIVWINGQTIQGWASMISITLILGSSQLIMLGILGEYVGRMYMETKKRPLFIIKDIITSKQEYLGEQIDGNSNQVRKMQDDIKWAING